MLAYLPANPMKDDNESDMFENLVPRSIEHFACSVLMDMDQSVFQMLSKVTPDTVKKDIDRLAELIDNQLVKNLVPADTELDEQILERMASVNLNQSKDDVTLDTLKESVLIILEQTDTNYRHSRKRLKKLKKDFMNLDKQKTAKQAIDQLSDMISGRCFNNYLFINFYAIIAKSF